jgi:signal transduction histidine kinase
MSEFSKARLILFGWYVLISFLLLTVFTIVAFQAEKQAFNQIDQMLSDRIQRPVVSALLEKRLSQFTADFRERLLYFDIILFLVAAGTSWFLSGKTLKPIEDMLHKQQEFSADASHELRTPLASIIMELEAIKRTQKKIPKDISASLENIKGEALRMKQLVNNLLALVRSQPKQNTNNEVFILNNIAMEAYNSLKNIALDKKLECIFTDNELLKIKGDAEAIQQVITIILENAIKYTPSGKITIKVGSAKQKTCLVEISDTGIGIPAGDIPHIFERFYRVRTRTKTQGTGLGLAIAKKIIEEHKGRITVKSSVDKGSLFTVFLPMAS